jgi:hypothetical protein
MPYLNPPDAHFREQHIVPRLKALVDTPDLKKQRARWDWDLFVPHNEIWRSSISRLMRERDQFRKLGAKWMYVDVWEQALQRPDAHSDPAVDCLHCKSFCDPREVGGETDDCDVLVRVFAFSLQSVDNTSSSSPLSRNILEG